MNIVLSIIIVILCFVIIKLKIRECKAFDNMNSYPTSSCRVQEEVITIKQLTCYDFLINEKEKINLVDFLNELGDRYKTAISIKNNKNIGCGIYTDRECSILRALSYFIDEEHSHKTLFEEILYKLNTNRRTLSFS